MENLGSYLKELRESAHITYDNVFEAIHVHSDRIKLIEDDDIRSLGDYGFARAMVFNYARFLNADLDRVMHAFDSHYPENLKNGYQSPTLVKEKKIMLSTNFLWGILIVILSLSLAFILYYSYQKGYLTTPEFFSRSKPDSVEVKQPVVEAKPDSLRLRLLQIKESLPEEERSPANPERPAIIRKNTRDTTDYIGIFMGNSPFYTDLD